MRWFTVLLLVVAACNKASASSSGPIAIKADEKGFTPASVSVEKGKPATLVFTRTTDGTCATAVVFPELNVKKDLPLNTPVSIDVPTDTARTLKFTCGMGMYESSVVVK
jgi:plastocyanin domain-containing protein